MGCSAARRRSVDQPIAQRARYRLRPRTHVQLFVNRTEVIADRMNTDPHWGGGGLVLMPFGQQLQQPKLLGVETYATRRLRPSEENDHPDRHLVDSSTIAGTVRTMSFRSGFFVRFPYYTSHHINR